MTDAGTERIDEDSLPSDWWDQERGEFVRPPALAPSRRTAAAAEVAALLAVHGMKRAQEKWEGKK